ncbi:hypothetical protein B0H14DRAFT_3079576 [Mycena olivaceomarginata]|nr:hypothetical protein B0H14DRAFT_3079576 [Mycena olivaceomarginata]
MQPRRTSNGLTPALHCPPPPPAPPPQKSTDSWNSSNQDLDDLDYDWKPDQILLLRRTLDALPPHLMTPFNGPISTIARGVTQAKGEDWPHSLRATRVKLIELARTIAQEDSKPKKTIPEESAMDCSESYFAEADVLQQTTNIGMGKMGLGPRRPLYRQSSMDFLDTSDPLDSDTINRLSTRLQKADRFIPNASSHPYSRSQMQRRSSSPPRPSHVPSLIRESTPSSSHSFLHACVHPSCGPRLATRCPGDDITAPYPSSDEEEKFRSRRAKKARVRSPSISSPPPLSPSPEASPISSATRSPSSSRDTPKAVSPEAPGPHQSIRAAVRHRSVHQAQSMFGAELPRLSASAQQPGTPVTTPAGHGEGEDAQEGPEIAPPPGGFRLGAFIAPVGEDGHEADMEECEDERSLGSAFQLR